MANKNKKIKTIFLGKSNELVEDIPDFKQSPMRYAYWIVGFFVIAGNTWVIVSTFVRTSCFKKTWPFV